MTVRPRSTRPNRPSRPTRAALAIVSALATLALVPAGSAHADEASDAPVTAPDKVTVRGSGNPVTLDVLANDTDPNGDELAICRVEVPDNAPIEVIRIGSDGFVDGPMIVNTPTSTESGAARTRAESAEQLLVVARRNRSRTVTFTYYACDHRYLRPATVTVTIKAVPRVTGTTTARPGRVRFTNPGDRGVTVLYGGMRQDRPDGRLRVAAHSSAVVKVARRTIVFVAFNRRTGELVNLGIVRGIEVPGGGRAAASATAVSPRAERLWRSAS